MGFGSSFKSAVSNAVSSIGNMASSVAAPVRETTTALAQTPALLANGQNYLLSQGINGAGQLLQNPQALASIAGGVATGGASTGLSSLLGGFGVPDILSSFLGGNAARSPAAAPTVVNAGSGPASNDGGYGAPGQSSSKWLYIGLAAAAVVVVLIVVMFRGRK